VPSTEPLYACLALGRVCHHRVLWGCLCRNAGRLRPARRPSEPLTTPEVANSLDAARRTVYKRLEKLASSGELKTKKVGANARVWWRSHPDEGSSVNATNTHATPTLSNAERTVIEKILEASPISIVVVEPSGQISSRTNGLKKCLNWSVTRLPLEPTANRSGRSITTTARLSARTSTP